MYVELFLASCATFLWWYSQPGLLNSICLSVMFICSVSTVIDVPLTGGIGEKRVQPLTLSELQTEYHQGIGELRLDLTHLDFPRRTTTNVKATVGIGHLLLLVPRDITVEVHGHAGMGAVQFLDQDEGGLDVERSTTLSGSGEAPPHVVIEADIGLGEIEVQDAAS